LRLGQVGSPFDRPQALLQNQSVPDPRLLSSETAYSGRLFNVALDRLDMDNGVVAFRETIRHPGAVCMVPVTDSGDLLLVTQYRHAAGRRLLELPAGTLEPGEPPIDAVSRELQEEVGHKPGRIDALGGFFVAPGYTTEFIHLFVCSQLETARLEADEDEDIEVEVRTAAQALAAIDAGEICDAKSVIGVLRWQRWLTLNR
jgi:ADP-ribose pyrophosphatase